MMAYAVISQPKHEKTFPVFLEGPSQKKVSATTLVEPHGLAPVVPPHASGGGTLQAYPTMLLQSFEGYPPRIHPWFERPCLHAEVLACR